MARHATEPLGGGSPRPLPDEVLQAAEVESGLGDLSLADYKTILTRAAKGFLDDNAMLLASALAYSTFFAIPAVLLVAVGIFTLVAGPDTIASLMGHFNDVMPAQATTLLQGSLENLDAHPASGIAMTVVGLVLALWSTTGAMTAYMTAVNIAYDRKDRRSFLRKRLAALTMVAVTGSAFLLVAVLLIFGPPLQRLVGDAVGAPGAVAWVWWVAQWPILLGGLLVAFAVLLYLAPAVEPPRWQLVTPGSLLAALLWIAASGAFAVYTSAFGSYNKTWGSLSAVIVMLTWLWLAGMALLFGAEVNAEIERCRRVSGRARAGA